MQVIQLDFSTFVDCSPLYLDHSIWIIDLGFIDVCFFIRQKYKMASEDLD